MIKHGIFLIILSVLAVLFKTELGQALQWTLSFYNQVSSALSVVFSGDKLGLLVQKTLSLILIPLILSLALSLVFWVFKRKAMPGLAYVVWIVWTVLLTLLVMQDATVVSRTVVALFSSSSLPLTF